MELKYRISLATLELQAAVNFNIQCGFLSFSGWELSKLRVGVLPPSGGLESHCPGFVD